MDMTVSADRGKVEIREWCGGIPIETATPEKAREFAAKVTEAAAAAEMWAENDWRNAPVGTLYLSRDEGEFFVVGYIDTFDKGPEAKVLWTLCDGAYWSDLPRDDLERVRTITRDVLSIYAGIAHSE